MKMISSIMLIIVIILFSKKVLSKLIGGFFSLIFSLFTIAIIYFSIPIISDLFALEVDVVLIAALLIVLFSSK